MPTDTAKIERWYDAKAEWEWNRTHQCRVEFAVTLRVVREHFPAPPAAVLDVGGGPGRYAIALAEPGYRVTLLDLSAGCLDLARQQAAERRVPLAACVHGNALDLAAFADASFAAVLSLGPFYHLLTAAERQRALAEARRVLAPGGVLVAAFLCRFAAVRFWGHVRPEATARELQREFAILATGVMSMGGADPEAGGWVDA